MASNVIVVGDDFEAFAAPPAVQTLSQHRQALRDGAKFASVLIGQGLAHDDVDDLVSRARGYASGLSRERIASLEITHKRSRDNVLITSPKRTGVRCYTMEMALNNRMDRLVDHVTGVHLSGMVLIEASRQAATATGEIDFDLASRPKSWGFVWTGCAVRFLSFAFPLPTRISLVISDLEGSTAERPKCRASLEFEQGGKNVCELYIDYNLLPRRVIDSLEAGAAKVAVSAVYESTAHSELGIPEGALEYASG